MIDSPVISCLDLILFSMVMNHLAYTIGHKGRANAWGLLHSPPVAATTHLLLPSIFQNLSNTRFLFLSCWLKQVSLLLMKENLV